MCQNSNIWSQAQSQLTKNMNHEEILKCLLILPTIIENYLQVLRYNWELKIKLGEKEVTPHQ